jgi:peptidoglycan hydrolase CwlO-like protein
MNFEERLKNATLKNGNPDVEALQNQISSLTKQVELLLGLIQTTAEKSIEVEKNLMALTDFVCA